MPRLPRRLLLSAAVLALVLAVPGTGVAGAPAGPRPDPAGILDLPRGFSYNVLATGGQTPVVSTESGKTFPMPEDPDANVLTPAIGGGWWLTTAHELTEPRPGDFQGDAGKAAVDEQAITDDGDSDGWGSVTRLRLSPGGRRVLESEVITTGLHNLCAGDLTPWGTMLVNEEFPFRDDPQLRSGWAWEVDPVTGHATRLTGMGRFSHEQQALGADGAWYLTDDRGDFRFLYRFVPNSRFNLVNGRLYGLAFDRASGHGSWVGPLDYRDPHADMVARGYDPAVAGFDKIEGIIAGPHGRSLYMSESGATGKPGAVWRFTQLSDQGLDGRVVLEGDFAALSHPDNLRFTPRGDLLVLEDNGSDLGRQPATGGRNQLWLFPRGRAHGGRVFAVVQATSGGDEEPVGGEPTGPWFHPNGRVMYLSIQADPSYILAVRGPWMKGINH
jgi:uncharacterized protein